MVTENVIRLCTAKVSVTAAMEREPHKPIVDIIQSLYKNDNAAKPIAEDPECTTEKTSAALQCGHWGPCEPSNLFLRAYADALACLDGDPMAGLVSPSLMGSHGFVPLTIVAPLADIIRHCSNMIVRAKREVFFITCSWAPSEAQKLIRDSLLELSKRATAGGYRVSAKFMYDKAGIANLSGSHERVKPAKYSSPSVGLPAPEDIPGVDLEVTSMHHIPLGTLHSKFCIVDREEAAIMSNNMEDNPNLEMMVHLQGPMVDGVLDTALISWSKEMAPIPPPPDAPAPTSTTNTNARALHEPGKPHFDDTIQGEMRRMQNNYQPVLSESHLQAVNRQLNRPVKKPIPATGPEIAEGNEMTPYVSTMTEHPVPMALVSRRPYGPPVSKDGTVPQNEAWLSLIRHAESTIFIQTPDLNAAPLLPALVEAVKRGVRVTYYVCFGYNDAGEMIPGQGGTNDQVAQALVASLSQTEAQRLRIYNYVAKDQDHPIHHSFASRSCHIKLLIADGKVAVQGSGNQDTQSWFHSQEVNVMVDSPDICRMWMDTIDRNQNTSQFGRAAADGIWRDAEGNPGTGYSGNPGKVEGLFKGVSGMVMKMKG